MSPSRSAALRFGRSTALLAPLLLAPAWGCGDSAAPGATAGSGAGGGSGGGAAAPDYPAELETFTRLFCDEVGPECSGADPEDCRRDVKRDFEEAVVTADQREACAACLAAKNREFEKLAASCDAVVDGAAVLAACDLDPADDFDQNGDPADDDDDACNGAP